MELFAADGHDAGGCERVTGKSGMRPFEAPVDGGTANTYDLTLTATAGSAAPSVSLTVAVTVADVDEEGELSLSTTRPEMGGALTATLTDPDGVTAGTAVWQWERSTGRNSWAVIDGAAGASYTPAAADTNTFPAGDGDLR